MTESQTDPQNSSPGDLPPQPAPAWTDDRNVVSRRWIRTSLVALLFIPLFVQWIPNEIAMWKQATARIAWENQNPVKAFQLSEEALQWSTGNPIIKREQARWYNQQQQYPKSIALFEELIEQQSDPSETLELRTELCDVLNRHAIQTQQPNDRVWQQWEVMDRWYHDQDRLSSLPALNVATYYNNRAYQLAVANTHIDSALESIHRCIELLGGETFCLFANPMSHVQGAYQSYQQKKTTEALSRLDKAVFLLDQFDDKMPQVQSGVQWEDSEAEVLARRIIQFRKMYGHVLFFRALLLRQANNHSTAATDTQKAISLGADEGDFQPALFSGTYLFTPETANFIGMALDTRGFLYLLNNQPHLAQPDLDQAVFLVEQYLNQVEELIQSELHRVSEPDQYRLQRTQLQQQLAVILYHRSLVFEKLQQPARAAKDRQRIEKMGFHASEMLF